MIECKLIHFSSCIFQDNVDDWARESGLMKDVYSHAQFTIAATAAENGREGLFFERKYPRLAPVQVVVSWKADPIPASSGAESTFLFEPGTYSLSDAEGELTDIDSAPLNARAWVVQERYLSTRIMHFGEVLYWECPELLASELYPAGIPSAFTQHFAGVMALKAESFNHRHKLLQCDQQPDPDALEVTSSEAKVDIYGRWLRLRAKYSGCERTRDDDLLIALLGMAMDVAEMLYEPPSGQSRSATPVSMRDIFVAGMWRLFMIEELCWSVVHSDEDAFQRPKRHQAPTWSWASSVNAIHGSKLRITYSAMTDHEPKDIARMFSIDEQRVGKLMQFCTVRYSAEVTDMKVDTSRLGDIATGYVRLKCRPFPARVHLTPNRKVGAFATPLLPNESPLNIYEYGNVISFDRDMADAEMDVTVISLLYILNEENGFRGVEGVILKKATAQRGDAYERIGAFYSGMPQDPHVPSEWVWARHEEAEVREIEVF